MTRILCVNGWAQPVNGLASVVPGCHHLDYGHCSEFAETDALIAGTMAEVDLVVGWSLGASILQHALASGAVKARRALFIAPPIQFITSGSRPGMDRTTFDLFRRNYETDPVRTARRFVGLIARGDSQETRIIRENPLDPTSCDRDRWLPWLDGLAECSFEQWTGSVCEQHLVQGEADRVVLPDNASAISEQNSHIYLHPVPECGHAPHWHDAAMIGRLVEGLCR